MQLNFRNRISKKNFTILRCYIYYLVLCRRYPIKTVLGPNCSCAFQISLRSPVILCTAMLLHQGKLEKENQRRHTTDAVENMYESMASKERQKKSRARKQDIIFHTVAPNYNYDAADEFFILFIRTTKKCSCSPAHHHTLNDSLYCYDSTQAHDVHGTPFALRCRAYDKCAIDKWRTWCMHFVFIKMFRFVLSASLMSISSKCFHFARFFFSLSPTENLYIFLQNKNISLEGNRRIESTLLLLSSTWLSFVFIIISILR